MRRAAQILVALLSVFAADACTPEGKPMNDSSRLADFAARYTAAWCSHKASSVAAFYSESGSLAINDGTPAVGRRGIEGCLLYTSPSPRDS